jgi:hypothetical protein
MMLKELEELGITETEFNHRVDLLTFAVNAGTIKFSTDVMTPELKAKFCAIRSRNGKVDLTTLDKHTAQVIKILGFALETMEPAPDVVN